MRPLGFQNPMLSMSAMPMSMNTMSLPGLSNPMLMSLNAPGMPSLNTLGGGMNMMSPNAAQGGAQQPDAWQMMSMMTMIMLQIMQLFMGIFSSGSGLGGMAQGVFPAIGNLGLPSTFAGGNGSAPPAGGVNGSGNGGGGNPSGGSPGGGTSPGGGSPVPNVVPSGSVGGSSAPITDVPLPQSVGGGYILPVVGSQLTSDFDDARSYGRHGGIDLAVPIGTPILAAQSGIVVLSRVGTEANDSNDGYGSFVKIRHDDGTYTLYAHMQGAPAVQPGQRVEQGQPIGRVGMTGNTEGPHVHYEIRDRNDRPVDPRPIMHV